MKGLRESSVMFCDMPGILCSASTLSKRMLTNSIEFKRKLVIRKALGLNQHRAQCCLVSQDGNQTVQEKPWR